MTFSEIFTEILELPAKRIQNIACIAVGLSAQKGLNLALNGPEPGNILFLYNVHVVFALNN